MQQTKEIPTLRFPSFKEEWKEKRFENIGRVIRGASPRPKGDLRYYGGTVPRLMVEDIARDGKFANPITDTLTEQGAKLSRLCPKGTLTIVCSGTAKTVGQASFLTKDACIHDGFLALMDIKKEYSPEFVYYLVQKFQERSERMATHGGTFINLTTGILKEFTRYFPSYEEQQKIAAFMGAVDEKIIQLQKKKELLEDYKKGCMQKLFSQELRFKDDNGNDFPDWENVKFGNIATFKKGKGISKADIKKDGANKCIRYGELYTEYGAFISDVISYSDTPLEGLVLSKENDMLMPTSDVTPTGLATASALDEKGVILGGDILIIRSKRLNNRYFSYYVSSHKHEIIRLVTGVTVYHIYGSDLSTLKFNLPSIGEQRKIADFLYAIDNRIALVAEELDKAKIFKKGLLQQMFV